MLDDDANSLNDSRRKTQLAESGQHRFKGIESVASAGVGQEHDGGLVQGNRLKAQSD